MYNNHIRELLSHTLFPPMRTKQQSSCTTHCCLYTRIGLRSWLIDAFPLLKKHECFTRVRRGNTKGKIISPRASPSIGRNKKQDEKNNPFNVHRPWWRRATKLRLQRRRLRRQRRHQHQQQLRYPGQAPSRTRATASRPKTSMDTARVSGAGLDTSWFSFFTASPRPRRRGGILQVARYRLNSIENQAELAR